ncbi:transposase [Mangrovicoccus sp. HB161399]|uniref:transposase n=1 Tax=Mangrovicoccus sp. HB161399 TaxID=2720392 RepID=UPI00155396DB
MANAPADRDGGFAALRAGCGRRQIAPERLVRASLLHIPFPVRSGRQLMAQLDRDLPVRRFAGLGIGGPVWGEGRPGSDPGDQFGPERAEPWAGGRPRSSRDPRPAAEHGHRERPESCPARWRPRAPRPQGLRREDWAAHRGRGRQGRMRKCPPSETSGYQPSGCTGTVFCALPEPRPVRKTPKRPRSSVNRQRMRRANGSRTSGTTARTAGEKPAEPARSTCPQWTAPSRTQLPNRDDLQCGPTQDERRSASVRIENPRPRRAPDPRRLAGKRTDAALLRKCRRMRGFQ